MDFQEAKTELCRRLNISYEDIRAGTVDLFDWDTLDSWINLAIHKAWDFYDWAFAEKTYTTTTTASGEYYDYPDDIASDSITLLLVESENGYLKPYEQINFDDFRRFRVDDELNNNTEKLWSSHQRFYFINPVAFQNVAGRDIEIIGKVRVDNLTASTSLLPFSPDTDNEENSGNEAVVKLAYALALSTEKMKNKPRSREEEDEALGMLNSLALKEKKLQAGYKHKDRPLFNVPKMY